PDAKAEDDTKTETPVPAPAAAPPAKTDPPKPGSKTVAKSMRHVQWAAELCDQIASLAKDTQYEADFEGDGSPIPGRIRGLTREMGDILRELASGLLAVKAKGVAKDPKFIETVAKAEELSKALAAAEDTTEKAGKALAKILAERDDLLKQRDALEKANTAAAKKFEATVAE